MAPLPHMLAAALAAGSPDVIRTREQDGIIEVVVLVRPANMSAEDFHKRVRDFDAER